MTAILWVFSLGVLIYMAYESPSAPAGIFNSSLVGVAETISGSSRRELDVSFKEKSVLGHELGRALPVIGKFPP